MEPPRLGNQSASLTPAPGGSWRGCGRASLPRHRGQAGQRHRGAARAGGVQDQGGEAEAAARPAPGRRRYAGPARTARRSARGRACRDGCGARPPPRDSPSRGSAAPEKPASATSPSSATAPVTANGGSIVLRKGPTSAMRATRTAAAAVSAVLIRSTLSWLGWSGVIASGPSLAPARNWSCITSACTPRLLFSLSVGDIPWRRIYP